VSSSSRRAAADQRLIVSTGIVAGERATEITDSERWSALVEQHVETRQIAGPYGCLDRAPGRPVASLSNNRNTRRSLQ